MQKKKMFRFKPATVRILLMLLTVCICQSAYAAGTNVEPKKLMGWIKWITISILSIVSVLSILKGVLIWGDDASKGKMCFMGGMLGAIFAGMTFYIWEKIFGSEVAIDLETDF